MPSTKHENRNLREPSTYERVAELVDDSKPRIQLWRYLRQQDHASPKEILEAEGQAARFTNRGTLSTYLGDLQDAGIVDRISQNGANEPDLWFVTDEFQPEPEKIVEERTVVETEVKAVPRYETMGEWIREQAALLGLLGFLMVFGSVVIGYEYLVIQVGAWPELLTFGSLLGLLAALAVGLQEVYR